MGVRMHVATPVQVCQLVHVGPKLPHVGMKPEQVPVPGHVGHPADVGVQQVGLPGHVALP